MNGQLLTFLDNRELALVSWLAALLIGLLATKKFRPTVTGLFKAIFAAKLVILYAAMIAYTAVVVYLLLRLRVATTDQISEIVFWFFGPAVILFSKFDKASQDEDFFTKTFIETVRYTVVIEFLINLRPAHIAIELLLVLIFVLLGATLAVAGTSSEYQQVKRFLEILSGLVVIALLSYTISGIIQEPDQFATLNTLRDFLVPIGLTIGFIPFVYFVALFSAYELLFVRMEFLISDAGLRQYARRRVIRFAFLRMDKLRRISRNNPSALMQAATKAEVDAAIDAAKGR